MIVNLVRTSRSDEGTFGQLIVSGMDYAITAEPPWKDNQQSISCIPTGEYRCEKVDSPKFGKVYHIKDVPGRSHILIHAGNFAGDESLGLECNTYGCVLLGTDLGRISGQTAVTSSRAMLQRFHNVLNNKNFNLIVSEFSDIS